MKSLIKLPLLAVLASGALLAMSGTAQAQGQIYYQDFVNDDTANWTSNGTIGAHSAEFFFDYSTVGIPLSPNSTNSSTTAMRLRANFGPAAGASAGSGLSVSPTGFSITENFEMRFDMWLNFNGPFPGGGNGSTIIGGAGFGTAGTSRQTAGAADSVYVSASCDGGSSADYRVYTPAAQTSFPDGSAVYVNVVTRNADQPYYATNFPGQTLPAAQLALYPQQTNSAGGPTEPGIANNGVVAFKWRDVLLSKIANIITYKIDGITIAVLDLSTNGTLGGANILFNYFDINATISSDVNFSNLNFALYDNIRITNYIGVVSATAPTPAAAEPATPGVFSIVRTDPGAAITVNYAMSGTAVNGVDYTNLLGGALSGSVQLQAGQLSTNITVVPVDDTIPELLETIVLSVQPGTGYFGAGGATVTISDNDPNQLTLTNVSSQMYERTNDFATFRVTRFGDTNASSYPVNFSFGSGPGSATFDSDYYTNITVTFEPGVQTTNFNVYPIVDAAYEGSETVTVNLAAAGASEYTIGSPSSASITLVDANGPAETILFQDNFDVDHTANWTQFFVANNGTEDKNVDFNFAYTGYGIPEAPHGGGNGLWMNVNKDVTASAAALNFYPNGQSFSGNFALRFDMFLSVPLPSTVATEYCLAGINHTGTKTNWWRSGGVPAGGSFDGLFAAIETDNQAAPNYALYSAPTVANNPTMVASNTAAPFVAAFKANPFGTVGTVGNSNNPSGTFAYPVWADVELSQIGRIITLKINNTTIYSRSNATAFTSGNIMLGYEDAFDSISPGQSYVVIDNVRVVRLTGLNITAIQDLGATVQIDFTFDLSDVPSSFKVQSASLVTGPYADAAATIVQLTPGTYRATVVKSGSAQHYRIRHQ